MIRYGRAIYGHMLMEYVEGSKRLKNPVEMQQDQLILGWLLSLITPVVLSGKHHVSPPTPCGMLSKVCMALNTGKNLEPPSKTVDDKQKGSKSLNDHLAEVSKIMDALAIAGEVMMDSDMVLYTLVGLGYEDEAFVQNITT